MQNKVKNIKRTEQSFAFRKKKNYDETNENSGKQEENLEKTLKKLRWAHMTENVYGKKSRHSPEFWPEPQNPKQVINDLYKIPECPEKGLEFPEKS